MTTAWLSDELLSVRRKCQPLHPAIWQHERHAISLTEYNLCSGVVFLSPVCK